MKKWLTISLSLLVIISIAGNSSAYSLVIPDTDQSICYHTLDVIASPSQGEPFYGQDAQYESIAPAYTNNGDGTVTDLASGLMWQQNDGISRSWQDALEYAETLNLAEQDDWRLPNARKLQSIVDYFRRQTHRP